MLNKIIHFSLQNRLMVLVASVLLMVGGLYMAFHTEVDVFPDLNAPTVVIMTEAGGMAAEDKCAQGALVIHYRFLCRMGRVRLEHRHLSGPTDSV